MINVKSYCRPCCLEEALDSMASEELTPIAGGTDLIPQMRNGEPRRLLDTGSLGLDCITVRGTYVEIGACVTHSRLCEDTSLRKALPLLSEAASLIGSRQIRNRGTIGGNIVNASPSADTLPALLNYDADVVLISKSGKRKLRLDDFITGPYITGRKTEELLSSIICRVPEKGTAFSFTKLGRREEMNISRMTLAVSLTMDEGGRIKIARLTAGSVFPVARRMVEVESLLARRTPSRKLFADAGALAAELMIKESGARWSTPYKKPVLAGLVERALNRSSQARGL